MDCLRCGCNQFIIETDEQKPFIGTLDKFSGDAPCILIFSCTFCGDSFLKMPGETIQSAYKDYLKYR